MRAKLILTAVLAALLSFAARADDKVALVIGNSSYAWGYLENPANDAELVAGTLEDLGFHVIKRIDVDKPGLESAIQEYVTALVDAGDDTVGVVWYAGHGVRGDNGKNYLIPLGAEISRRTDVPFQTIELEDIIEKVNDADGALSPDQRRVRLYFFDACRNNPLPQSIFANQRALGGTGLGEIQAPIGTIVAYSTSPNTVANDGDGDNSPYAEAFAKFAKTPGLSFDDMYQRLATEVTGVTGGSQVPWKGGVIIGDVYCLAGCTIRVEGGAEVETDASGSDAGGTSAGDASLELAFWNEIRELNDRALYAEYLDRFPNGVFRSVAQRRIAALDGAADAIAEVEEEKSEFDGLGDACETGDYIACVTLGYAYDTGDGVARDDARARELYRRACDGADMWGCHNLGVFMRDGRGGGQDVPSAAELFQRACDGGHRQGACNNLGVLLRDGHGVTQDRALAATFFERGCDGGNASACVSLGYAHDVGQGVAQNDDLAADLYRRGCDGGDALGCYDLGVFHRDGRGVAQDLAAAASYFAKGCEGGQAWACNDLGLLRNDGRGAAQDFAKAATLFGQACEGGVARACMRLGYAHDIGRGVAQDDVRAASLYDEACRGGDMTGCHNRGVFYRDGRGGPEDLTLAARLFEQSCLGGEIWGCNNLGVFRRDGVAGAQDLAAARELFQRACDGGQEIACDNLAALR